jgi:hypothetical protein
MDGMIPLRLAIQLRDAGLAWKPAPGDQFAIPDREMDDEVFVLSNMTIEVHEMPDGPLIGFNGTTEWALDDLAKDEAVWLPREDQLRDLLGEAFHRLERDSDGHRVSARFGGRTVEFAAPVAAEAYGSALLYAIGRAGHPE